MSRALVLINGDVARRQAISWIQRAPINSRVELKAAKRSLPQNDRLWAMWTDISRQKTHHGAKLSPEDWKFLFLAALKRELRLVPNLDGDGFVALSGRSSSDLTKEEASDLIEVMLAWGAREGVIWSEPAKDVAA